MYISVDDFLKEKLLGNPFSNKIIKLKSKLREYKIWKQIKSRTSSYNRKDAKSYILKNIQMDPAWKESFELFLWDMGKSPGKDYSIDRINNDLGYNPSNCRWATKKEQSSNRGSFNIKITFNGKTQILKDWATELNINYITLYNRLFKSNFSFEKAISYEHRKVITINNETRLLKDWCELYNIPFSIVYNRINKHKWDPLKALTTVPRKSPNKIQSILDKSST